MMKAHERRNKFTVRVKQKEEDRKQKELDQKFDKHNDGLSQDRGKLTETYGEEAAAIYMANKYKNTQMFTGFASGPGFDQVWIERADNQQIIKIFIVEAKGKNATLSKKKTETKGYQMDCEWVAKTVLELEANNNRRPGGDDNTADSLVPISQYDNNISYEDYKLTEEGTKSAFYRSKSQRTIVIDHMKKALLSDPPPSLVGLVIGIDGNNIVGEHALPLGGTYPKRNNDGEYCYNSSGEPYGIVNNE